MALLALEKLKDFWNLGSPQEVICNQKEENKI